MATAIGYLMNQWDTLVVFLKDPRLRLDNNVSERALRIQALGRNNFLFVGHDEAGQNLAILQTVVATASSTMSIRMTTWWMFWYASRRTRGLGSPSSCR